MYVITEWLQRYEVNEKGRPAKAGDKLRATPLKYIRSKVHGRAQGAGFHAMQKIAKLRAFEVFGLFHKLVEIAGCEEGGKRGAILNAHGEPANIEDLASILRFPASRIAFAMQVLTNPAVNWILDQELPETPGNSRKLPQNSGALYNETKRNENEIELNITERDGIPNPSQEGGSAQRGSDENSNSTNARASSISARLDFSNRLRGLLLPRTPADLTALFNLQNWADQQLGDIQEKLLKIAEDSRAGENRLAVFFSRVKDELGYRPRAQRDKRKN